MELQHTQHWNGHLLSSPVILSTYIFNQSGRCLFLKYYRGHKNRKTFSINEYRNKKSYRRVPSPCVPYRTSHSTAFKNSACFRPSRIQASWLIQKKREGGPGSAPLWPRGPKGCHGCATP